jgi:hypothetical protein
MGFVERRSSDGRYREPLGRQRSRSLPPQADAQRFAGSRLLSLPVPGVAGGPNSATWHGLSRAL